MIAVVASFVISEGKETEFETVANALVAEVRANEPGCSLYQLAKDRKTAGRYKMLELYTDMDAFKVHGGTDWFKVAMPKMAPCFAEAPVVEIMECVG
ncbi:MAG: putative quinol monooxygenase [Blastomonas sp.]